MGNDMVKLGVEEVPDSDARIPIPTEDVQLVGQALTPSLLRRNILYKPFGKKGISFLLCLLLLKKYFLQIKC